MKTCIAERALLLWGLSLIVASYAGAGRPQQQQQQQNGLFMGRRFWNGANGEDSRLNGSNNDNNGQERPRTTSTAMRPLSPSRASSPIPMRSTGISDAEENITPTTTSTTSTTGTNILEDTESTEESSSGWSRWQNLLQPRSSTFDMVPLPRPPRKKHRAVSSPSQQQQQQPSKRSRSGFHRRPKRSSGTRFDVRPPSPERLSRWFGSTTATFGTRGGETRRKRSRSTVTQLLFNHDSVGMTNPVLHISLESPDDEISKSPYPGRIDYDSSTASASVSLASSATPAVRPHHHHQQQQQQHFELQDSWIPASATRAQPSETSSKSNSNNHGWAHVLQYKLKAPPIEQNGAEEAWFPAAPSPQPQNRRQRNKKWRQCRYRRRVGQGQACYERVRDAALAWQFNHTDHPHQGILPVHAVPQSQPSPKQQQQQQQQQQQVPLSHKKSRIESTHPDCFQLDDRTSQNVQPLWSGPHTEGSRRFVTFTSTGFKSKWLPKLYTMNPVMVVYDLLDQRGPETTYSSTAYATLKGHLLRGEERVTVAMRDDTGFVDVEILSYSRPAGSIQAKFVWPLIGSMQDTFFQNQMNFLEQIAVPMPSSSSMIAPAQ